MTETGRRAWRFEHGVSEPLVHVEDFLPTDLVVLDEPHGRRGQGLARSAVVLDAVESWTARGESAREIGSRLGVTSRTVVRLRRACRQRDAA
jgi:hypothetical protein